MESEDRLEGLVGSGESSSEAGSQSDSEGEAAGVTPAAAQHNYNLRTKRTALDTVEESGQTKSSSIAPGVGAEADRNQVGGRDAGDATDKRVPNGDSPDPVVRKDGVRPKSTYARSPTPRESRGKGVDRSGGVAWDIPVLRAEGRSRRAIEDAQRTKETARRRDLGGGAGPTERDPSRDLSPLSGEEPSWEEWDRFRRARLTERSREAPQSSEFLPTNEFARPGSSSRPSVAGRNAKSRLEPRATDLLERSAPVEPGRGRKFDIAVKNMFILCIVVE